jgi:hypothetical protein
MMTFDPNNTSRDTRFDRELARLRALVDDMGAIRSGIHPERLAGAAPILDTWVLTHRPEACLAGRSTGHPKLPGAGRPIVTSDLWLLSKDHQFARTLSRWYRLGRPADHPFGDS